MLEGATSISMTLIGLICIKEVVLYFRKYYNTHCL